VAALGYLVTINAANPDADVAAFNLTRRDELSIRYLNLLSDDAVPALAAGLDQLSGDDQARLRADLSRRLRDIEESQDRHSWPSFHLARWRAHAILADLRHTGKIAA